MAAATGTIHASIFSFPCFLKERKIINKLKERKVVKKHTIKIVPPTPIIMEAAEAKSILAVSSEMSRPYEAR